MIQLIFHTPPTYVAKRRSFLDLKSLMDEVEEPMTDLENDNFYFVLDTDREHGLELKQSLSEMGHLVSVKDDVEAYFA